MEEDEDYWKSASSEGYSELMSTIMMFTLSLDHRLRVVQACCLAVRVFTKTVKDMPCLPDMTKQATGDLHHHIITLPMEQRRPFGSPHIHAFLAAMAWAVATAAAMQNPAVVEKIKACTEEFMDSVGIARVPPTDPAELDAYQKAMLTRNLAVGKQVPWFRVTTARVSTMGKLEINVTPGSKAADLWNLIDELLQARFDGETRQGLAPRSGLARKIQQAIDDNR